MSVNKEFVLEAMSHSCIIAVLGYLAGYLQRIMTVQYR
jgi:hypothetical protein